jgi:hypothetical protein
MATRAVNTESSWEEVIAAINAIVYRDRGVRNPNQDFGDVVKNRASIAAYLLDVDNAHGEHANFGGILTVADSGVALTAALSATSLALSGNETVGGTLGVTGATTLAGLSAGATTLSANLSGTTASFSGLVQCNAGLSVNSGTLNAGATAVAGLSATSLSVTPGNATVAGTLGVTGASTLSGGVTIGNALSHTGSTAGFFNTAATTKPTVTGSRGGNLALASVLTALAGLGLIVNSSSA